MNNVFVLVCDEMPERTATIKHHMAERGITPTYIRAAHGKTWGLATTLEFGPGERLPPGHVSLNVSAWFMWQHAHLSPGKPDDAVLFFEDDAVLPGDFAQQLPRIHGELYQSIPDWDLVFLGMTDREPGIWNKVTERIGGPNSRLCRLENPFGTHALMVRRRALPVLLEHMRAAHRNLDQQLYERVLKPGHVKWCAVLPGIVTQRTYDHAGTGIPEWMSSCGETIVPDAASVARSVSGHPEPSELAAANALINPLSCIYRSEMLDEPVRDTRGKTHVVATCARFNAMCHTKVGIDIPDVLSCDKCTVRGDIPSPSVRERLPLPDGQFNPSIHQWMGKTILATRDSWGHSQVALWELTNTKSDWTGQWKTSPIGSYKSDHPNATRLEDPRLFVAPNPETGLDHLHAMFNLPDGYPARIVQVGYVRFKRDLSGIEFTDVFRSPAGNMYEKNWMPFYDGNEIRWVYATKPMHIVRGQQHWQWPNNLPWAGGVIRGGAAPVRVSPEDGTHAMYTRLKRPVYYHFFHGCLKRIEGSVYTVGCAVFDSAAPFTVLRQTAIPLLWPDNPAPGENVVKRYVCWPGGAIAHAGAWHLAIGVDDCHCKIVRIPFDTVESALNDIPEQPGDVSVSLRDTMVATGIPDMGVS